MSVPSAGNDLLPGAPYPVDPTGSKNPVIERPVSGVDHRWCEFDKIGLLPNAQHCTTGECRASTGHDIVEHGAAIRLIGSGQNRALASRQSLPVLQQSQFLAKVDADVGIGSNSEGAP